MRLRIFVDFWNFQLNWKRHAQPGQDCDWRVLPAALVTQSQALLGSAGVDKNLSLEETRVYASVEQGRESTQGLKRWLDSFLSRQPSYRVLISERKPIPAAYRCKTCGQSTEGCPQCGVPFRQSVEKGVDTGIVTDLLSLAWEDAYDVALLLTSDSDFVPAVIRLQEKGIKVINATWRGNGFHLAKTSWSSFELNSMIDALVRTKPKAVPDHP